MNLKVHKLRYLSRAHDRLTSITDRAKIQLCPLLSESDQITDLAALPCTLTHSESRSRFRVWWLACADVERQDRQRASLSHGRARADSMCCRSTSIACMSKIVGALVRCKRFYEFSN